MSASPPPLPPLLRLPYEAPLFFAQPREPIPHAANVNRFKNWYQLLPPHAAIPKPVTSRFPAFHMKADADQKVPPAADVMMFIFACRRRRLLHILLCFRAFYFIFAIHDIFTILYCRSFDDVGCRGAARTASHKNATLYITVTTCASGKR